MLMRALEEPIFDRTRAWLAERQDHVFTLVVDELHLYRGTKGSEVALVVRNLLSRLGIEPDSAQLRCMATSASLAGDNSGQVFLEQFFGVDRSSFVVLPGRTKELGGSLPLRRADLIQAATAAPTEDLADLAVNAQLASAVALACHDPKTGRYRATPLATVAERLFDEPDDGSATRLVLEAVAAAEERGTTVPLRAHMFARTIRGVWACSNRDCDEVPAQQRPDRRIGRLYSIPATTCSCGGRVLELLYCYECGDVSLGGFVIGTPQKNGYLLGPSPTDTFAASVQPVFRRLHGQYAWYWPGDAARAKPWTHSVSGGPAVTLAFAPATYSPFLGYLEPGQSHHTGYMLAVQGLAPNDRQVPALPEQCPRCQMRGYNRDTRKFFRGVVRSPIRAHAGGLAQATQLVMSQLVRSLGDRAEDTRTIVFTDSRDDAARTAIEVETNHYRDLVRQLIRQVLKSPNPGPADLLRRGATGNITAAETSRYADLMVRHPTIWSAYLRTATGQASAADHAAISTFEAEAAGSNKVSWSETVNTVQQELVGLGVTPGGPAASLQTLDDGTTPWYMAFRPPQQGLWQPLSPGELGNATQRYRMALAKSMADAVFDRARRDIESIRAWLGRASAVPGARPTVGRADRATGAALVRAAARCLTALHRRRRRRDHDAEKPDRVPDSRRRAAWRGHRRADRRSLRRDPRQRHRRPVGAAGGYPEHAARHRPRRRHHVGLRELHHPASAPLRRSVRRPGLPPTWSGRAAAAG